MSDYSDKQNLVLACKSGGYLVSNLADQFDRDEFEIVRVNNVSSMSKFTEHIDGCLIYLDEEMLDDEYIDAFFYAVGDTIVVADIECAKKLIGKYRMVTLQGELLEKSGSMTGGTRVRRGLSFSQNDDDELEKLKNDNILDKNGKLLTITKSQVNRILREKFGKPLKVRKVFYLNEDSKKLLSEAVRYGFEQGESFGKYEVFIGKQNEKIAEAIIQPENDKMWQKEL